ncbi:DNA polymerase III subunit gamma/tau [Clostridium saccharoperbutylacetonicum]|uniref:DNA-directed DNA polymerase n=1 Tax=Clostridium saccharoperbutylacetonicum N1-4(HMT) TaxID=931276 RepID=M1MXU5_9CLOT|nr:DNA polymerase III subunit gamma/tau [Clostridium saccharoperbutylacetonicum]AGF59351.1 DNA polymerase III subunit gamma/tau [Clostridium saccharoperbutylacetonicum N1-4(HMT)]AQR98022.1 DNA polymerase III subunit tau [Clostridium saccharoperbutylacetonicum]NRT59861.1 DNA polymerase-3 subunit gamma/tau [Clostridium saccharoperbutylacetonicum]NSB23173.1 DNA polymerase-3 subunit gamma/tau [Clostridium saccharoperbutylacetonicum]NSB33915.1 DNA polymerase-3 subunit gamma/tau [Clostridium sacchar
MGYTALYRECRPKKFEDVIGQEHITTTLKNEILNDRIAHAYLFCGTRGTGKTSTAKVMAKALNCLDLHDGEPCNECEMCKKINDGLAIDVIELDAASNNGIDKIRDIIDDTKYPPQEARYKIYILDEVHMLSVGAVNAFLKTLEEPPKNVIFILATTDPQKLPITILSRCQRFDFKRINQKEISNLLKKITEAQNVAYEQKSLDLISRVCDGAMRDALSILDQAIAMGEKQINYEDLISILGLVTNEYLFDITYAIIDRSIEKSMVIVDKLVYSGKDMQLFIKDLIAHFRNLLMVKVTNNPEEVLDMSLENIYLVKEQGKKIRVEEIMRDIRILQDAEINSKASKQSRLYLELAIIKMCKIEYDTSNEIILSRINQLEESIKGGKIQIVQSQKINEDSNYANTNIGAINNQNTVKTNTVAEKKPEVNPNSKITVDDVGRAWTEILEKFKAKRAMIVYASIVTARPYNVKGGVVTLEYDATYAFNKERLQKLEYREIVNSVFSETFKEKVIVDYVVKADKDYVDNEQILKEKIDGIPFEVYEE